MGITAWKMILYLWFLAVYMSALFSLQFPMEGSKWKLFMRLVVLNSTVIIIIMGIKAIWIVDLLIVLVYVLMLLKITARS